jgi:hypothetical protein
LVLLRPAQSATDEMVQKPREESNEAVLMGVQVSPRNSDIEALLGRAAECELRARLAEDPSDRDQHVWFATKYREKAASLGKATRRSAERSVA